MNASSRIVSLLSSATEMLFALELGDRVVGISHECDFPAAVQSLPRVTRSRIDARQTSAAIDAQVRTQSAAGEALYTIDTDLLRALRPELIVTQSQCDVCAVKLQDVLDLVRSEPMLRDTRVIALNPASLDDVFADIQQLGAATGRADAAAALVASLRRRVAAVRDKTAALAPAERPRVACVEWIEPLMLAGNWTPQLIDWAGGRCELVRGGRHSEYHAWPTLVAFDPEVIVIAPCGFDLARTMCEARSLPLRPGWAELSAVRTGRVFALDGNAYLNRSGPRLVETLEILAHLLQPPLFPELPATIDQAASVAQRRWTTAGESTILD